LPFVGSDIQPTISREAPLRASRSRPIHELAPKYAPATRSAARADGVA
jgi:hypothetical protein